MTSVCARQWAGLLLAGEILWAGVWAQPASAAEPPRSESVQTIGPVSVLQVRPDAYMLTLESGMNVAVVTGPQGTAVVNTGPASTADALLAAIKKITRTPIRVVINTSADAELVGGNETVAAAGQALNEVLFRPAINSGDVGKVAAIIARQSALERIMSRPGPAVPTWALPSEVFSRPQYNFSLNNEGVEVVWQPAAHSDSDTVVLFRRSDVVVTGAIFDITRFPVIDLEHGGSIEGEINALNQVMNTLVIEATPVLTDDGGTMIIPLRGQLCSQADLLAYRDMVAAVRDRIQDLIDHGKSLAQVKAADPVQGYRSRYGSVTGSWTTDQFVEAAYKSLMAGKKVHKHKAGDEG